MSLSFVDALSLVRQMPVGGSTLVLHPEKRTDEFSPHSASFPFSLLSLQGTVRFPPPLRLGKNLPLQVSPLGSHLQTSVSLEKLQKQAGLFLQVQVKGASSFPRVDFGMEMSF